MTIVVAVACPEGLVLSADSRATIAGGRVATDHAQKLFSPAGRFGAATFGWGFLDGNTIAGLMEEFDAQTKPAQHLDELVERMKDFFGGWLKRHLDKNIDEPPPEGVDVLGFVLGGYDETGIGRLKTLYLPTGTVIDGAATASGECGATWEGEIDVLIRLVKGWDAARIDVSDWPEEQRQALEQVEYLTPFTRMALQDAVDFATFAIRTTIDMQRFSDGTAGSPGSFPSCGGTAELLVITSRGIQWLQETKLRAELVQGNGLV